MSAPADPLAFRSVLGGEAQSPGLGLADARLAALADELQAVDEACDAHRALHRGRWTDASEAAFESLALGYGPLEEEIAKTAADTMAGVMAKARATLIPCVRDAGDYYGITRSIVDDLMRLAGPASILARVA